MDSQSVTNVFTDEIINDTYKISLDYLDLTFAKFFDKVNTDYVMFKVMGLNRTMYLGYRNALTDLTERKYSFDPVSLLNKSLDHILRQDKRPDPTILCSINEDHFFNILCHYIEECIIDIILLTIIVQGSCFSYQTVDGIFLRNLFDTRAKHDFTTINITIGSSNDGKFMKEMDNFFTIKKGFCRQILLSSN